MSLRSSQALWPGGLGFASGFEMVPMGLFFDHAQRVVVFLERGDLTADYLARSLQALAHPDFPSTYDIVTRFGDDARFEISIPDLIAHAIDRKALQDSRTTDPIRSVLVNIPTSWPLNHEVWNSFFNEPDASLKFEAAATVEEAYQRLGRSAPPDFATLAPEGFYVAA